MSFYDCNTVLNSYGFFLFLITGSCFSSWSIEGFGKRVQRIGQVTSVRMPEVACSWPGRHIWGHQRDSPCRYQGFQVLVLRRYRGCAYQGILGPWVEEYFGNQGKLEGIVTIQTSMHWGTVPTPSEFRGQFSFKEETQEAGRTNLEHGSKLLMQHCHVVKTETDLTLLEIWVCCSVGVW